MKIHKRVREILKAEVVNEEGVPEEVSEGIQAEFPDALEIEFRDGGYSSWGESGNFTVDGTEYVWIKDFDEAKGIAGQIIRQDLEEEPEIFVQSWLEQFIYITDTDRRMIAGEEAGSMVEDLVSEGEERLFEVAARYNIDTEARDIEEVGEDLQDAMYEEIKGELADPIQYFVEDHGMYSLEELMKAPFIMINLDEAVESAVSTDGWAHFISHYDGNYDETPNGVVYFRE